MSAYEELLAQGNTEFAFALYQHLRTTEGNLFFSPYSISAALAMTCAGARRRTAFQMLRTLCLYLPQQELHPAMAALTAQVNEAASEGAVLLRIANSLWPQQGLPVLDSFIALMQENYDAAMMPVDYQETEAARCTINTWVEQKTEGKIQDLIPSGMLNELTELVLVNAIYFKGTWASRFDQRNTKYAPFWISPDRSTTVPMMSQTGRFRYLHDEGLEILELPYAGNKLSMLIVLPEEKDGLAALEQRLTAQNFAKWSKLLFANKIMVVLPKFALSFPFRLDSVLQAMGMTDAFRAEQADFSGIDGTKSLFISAALHKAFVAVNEEGTEAAAATAVVMTRSTPSEPPIFSADHPFAFLIRENSTGSILFIGRVAKPTAARPD